MADNNSTSTALRFDGALTLLFVGLKLGHALDWSWWWVLSPLWIGAAFSLVILAVAFVAVVIADLARRGRG